MAAEIDLRQLTCEVRYGGHEIHGSDFVFTAICHRCKTPLSDLVKIYKQRGLIYDNDTYTKAWEIICNGHR